MDKNYPKNKDPRPKRRRDKGNPYEIFTVGIETDSPHYYISFTDSCGIHICMEINRSLFELFDRFELDDLSYLNRVDKYHDGRELSDELALKTLEQHSQELDDPFKFDHLHDAIKELPRLQRKRLMLYYFNDYTITEIANLEGCSVQAVSKSIKSAEKKLDKILNKKKYFVL